MEFSSSLHGDTMINPNEAELKAIPAKVEATCIFYVLQIMSILYARGKYSNTNLIAFFSQSIRKISCFIWKHRPQSQVNTSIPVSAVILAGSVSTKLES